MRRMKKSDEIPWEKIWLPATGVKVELLKIFILFSKVFVVVFLFFKRAQIGNE